MLPLHNAEAGAAVTVWVVGWATVTENVVLISKAVQLVAVAITLKLEVPLARETVVKTISPPVPDTAEPLLAFKVVLYNW